MRRCRATSPSSRTCAVFGLIYGVPRSHGAIEPLLDAIRSRPLPADQMRRAVVRRANAGRLAKAMLNRAAALLLDEPTASLDPARPRTSGARNPRGQRQPAQHPVDLTQHVRGRRPSAIACCSCRTAGSFSRAIRRRCRSEHGKRRSKSCSSPSRGAARARSRHERAIRPDRAIVLRQYLPAIAAARRGCCRSLSGSRSTSCCGAS